MTITFGWGTIPILVTLIAWGWAILTPIPPSAGHYDFGSAFTAAARGIAATFVTLVVWLVYFAIKASV